MQRDDPLEVVGELGAVLGQAARERVLLQVVGVAQVIDAAHHGAEALAVAGDAADRDAAEVDAVVAALAADQPRALAFAAGAVVGDRHLQRGVDGLRARVGEEHLVEAGGSELDELLGELEGLRVRHVERRREVHLGRLRGDRRDDLRPGMACIHAPEAGHRIEHLAALRCPVVHVLRLRQKARRALELAARRERHPEGVEPGRRAGGGCRGRGRGGVEVLVHLRLPRLPAGADSERKRRV